MERKARNLSGIKEYANNPFKDALLQEEGIKARVIKVYDKEPFHNEDGDLSIMYGVDRGERKYYWEDRRTFVKEFTTEYSLSKVGSLSYNAHRLFTLLKSKIEVNAENVKVSCSDYLKFIKKTSKELYYSAVVDLIDAEIIALISDGVFYINPRIIYNGRIDALLPDAYDAYTDEFKMNNNPHKSYK